MHLCVVKVCVVEGMSEGSTLLQRPACVSLDLSVSHLASAVGNLGLAGYSPRAFHHVAVVMVMVW